MSPEILTLVAAVLAYDFARESWERTSSRSALREAISETSDEKDMATMDAWFAGVGTERMLQRWRVKTRLRGLDQSVRTVRLQNKK